MSSLQVIYTIVIVVLCTIISTVSPAAPRCFNCLAGKNADGCSSFEQCEAGYLCYRETIETETGEAEYNWGCASQQLCTLENSVSTRRKRLGIERCFECCKDNFCNFGACEKDYCADVKCDNGARCRNTSVGSVCDCTVGYTGDLCETEINECDVTPCQNNGTCTDNIGYSNCTCLPGFTGDRCETNIDECVSNPCQNAATCVDLVNGFQCACVPGFNGTFCETDIDECADVVCQYGSTCIDLVNDYQCDCPDGIIGSNCDINVDECANVTCENNGTCEDFINKFVCNCPLGFAGDLCETSLGRVCYDCVDQVSVNNCTSQVLCAKDEECYMEHELVSPGNYMYNMGCVPTAMCSLLQTMDEMQEEDAASDANKRNSVPIQLCYECCDTNGCNSQACKDRRP